MNKLILNYNHEFDIESYNRSTTIVDGHINSYANITCPDASGYNELVQLSTTTITDLIISSDNTSIYHLADQSAKITSIYESMTTDSRIVLSVQIQFDETQTPAQE